MKKVSVLIVEDKLLVAEDIASRLVKNDLDVSGTFASGEEAIEAVKKNRPDLILMDIQLSGKLDGISTVEIINAKDDIPVIYLTDHTDKPTLERAKKTLPANYLAKPFHEADLVRAIDLAFSNWQESPRKVKALRDHIFVKDKNSQVKVDCGGIVYLEADRAYCKIITDLKVYTQANSMGALYEQIGKKDFMKVHRSFVINVTKVTEVRGNVIYLGKHSVEVSQSMKKEVKKKFPFLK